MARETISAGDRLVITDSAPIADLNAFTWAAWVFTESSGLGTTVGHLFSKGPSVAAIYKRLRITGQTRLIASVTRSPVSSSAQSTDGALSIGAWVHIAMTYSDADGVRLYRNGLECGYASRSAGSGSATPDHGASLFLFNVPDGSMTFDGRLAEVGLWNRVLTTGEISLLATRGYSPVLLRAGLAGAWRLSGIAAPEPDPVHNNNATVYGTTSANHPPGIIATLPERTATTGTMRGELRRMA